MHRFGTGGVLCRGRQRDLPTNSLINDMIQRREHQKQERKHGTGMDR